MPFKASDAYRKDFTTASPTTGAAADADSLPAATADWIGSGTGSMALTVTKLDTGRYSITGTVPAGRLKGDVLNVSVAATCGAVAGKAVVDTQVIDSKRVGDLNDLGGTAQTGDNFARLGVPAGASIAADVAAVAAKTTNLPSDPADASDIAGAFTTVNTTLATIAGYIDTEVAAIKAKTDLIPAAPASTTNITAGTVTTVTNLTNAPTAGDFTAAMKTSLSAATPAVTVSDKTGFVLAAAGLDAVVIESGVNARQALSPILAACAGVLSGAGTGTITVKGGNVATTRITATTDSDGNRTSVTLALPA